MRLVPPLCGGEPRPRTDYTIIGRLEDGKPFLLRYASGITNWTSPADLGEALRKKILSGLRQQVRYAESLPSYLVQHDLRPTDANDPDVAARRAADIEQAFFRDVWRAQYLDDRDEDYVALAVPFAEKDAAKALGAKWDGAARVWRVKRQDNMSAFARWMPA